MKLAYNGYIYEARKLDTEQQIIEKYSKLDDSYFFSFRSINKIGLNPMSKFNTPNGVYTYNFQDMIGEDVPYRGSSSNGYVYVVKLQEGVRGIDSETYTIEDFERDSRKLDVLYKERVDFIYSESVSPMKNIWNMTYSIKKNANEWTNIFLKLGYHYARDRGMGIIHINEKKQTVFFSPKAYSIVDFGIYGNVAFENERVTLEWLQKHASTLTEKHVKSVAKFIANHYEKTGAMPKTNIFHSTNSKILTAIYSKAFGLIGDSRISGLFFDYPDTLASLGVTNEYAKALIEKFKPSFKRAMSYAWLKALDDSDRYNYVIEFKESFNKISEYQIGWIGYLPYIYRIKAVKEFRDSINRVLIRRPDEISELIYQLRGSINPSNNIKIFYLLLPSIREMTKKGQNRWVEIFEASRTIDLGLLVKIITTLLKDEVKQALSSYNVGILIPFLKSKEDFEYFKKIYPIFEEEIKKSLDEVIDTMGRRNIGGDEVKQLLTDLVPYTSNQ